ncbi:MAG TPA: hypothetical protein VKR42_03240 [Ktedonobacteraceae bacterium]|nr:hypothetical protein [Ktedonobacteraceae bacterium]
MEQHTVGARFIATPWHEPQRCASSPTHNQLKQFIIIIAPPGTSRSDMH